MQHVHLKRFDMASPGFHEETQVDSFLESSEGIVVVLDGKGRVLRLSSGAEKSLGYEKEELSGSSVVIMVPPDRRDWMTAVTKRAREDGVVQDIFMHWRTKDGRRLISKSSMKSVVNYQGEIVGIIISESPGGAKHPKKEEGMTPDQAMDLLNSSEIANVVTDLSGNIQLFNSGAEEITGFKSSNIRGTSISRLFRNREFLGEITANALRDGKVEDCEASITDYSDEKKKVSISISVIRNPSGAAARLSYVMVDITKRKEMERELELRAEKLRLINELATRIRSGRSLSEIHTSAVEGLSRLVQFDTMTLAVTIQTDIGLKISSIAGKHPDWLREQMLLSMDAGPIARAVKQGKPVTYTPIEIEELLDEALPEDQFSVGLVIPLFVGERFLGLLNLTSSAEEAFGPPELDVLIPVADHMALAIENARLVNALMENINIQTILMETGTALRSIMDLNEIYETAVARSQELISSDIGALYIFDPSAHGRLELVSSRGDVSIDLPRYIESSEDGIMGRFAFSNGPPLENDIANIDYSAEWERKSLRCMLLSKLVAIKGEIGVLMLARKEKTREYTSYELELLNLYSNHLSPSIENARLFEEAKGKESSAKEALESERRTREALDFVIDMFAHDSQNLIQGILGYLQLVSQENLDYATREYIEKAIRRLRADSYLVSGTALIFKNISLGRRGCGQKELTAAVRDAIRRYYQIYPEVEILADRLSNVSEEEVDHLLSVLFFHLIRFITKVSSTKRIEIDVTPDEPSDRPRIDLRIKIDAASGEMMRDLDEDEESRSMSTKLLDSFVVRLLGDIYGASIRTEDRGKDGGKAEKELICTIVFDLE
ncbi:MAG TPA: PAS domain S-box protein [Euryarchaeota archaeon]|nr:PAS domain S-box protein [Euryarchaeota archaeon]